MRCSKEKCKHKIKYLTLKLCQKHYSSLYYRKNKKKILAYTKNWSIANKESRRKSSREWARRNSHRYKDYYKKNKKRIKLLRFKRKDRINAYFRNRRKNDSLFKLTGNLRSRIWSFLKVKNLNKTNTLITMLGCDLETFKTHIKHQFKKGMTWENYGKWHIDHILPLCISKDINDVKKLMHYTNLQPLWAEENLKKANKDKKFKESNV